MKKNFSLHTVIIIGLIVVTCMVGLGYTFHHVTIKALERQEFYKEQMEKVRIRTGGNYENQYYISP